MKDKIIIFFIGLLVGAVISTGAFYVYSTTAKKCDNSTNQTMQMPGGAPSMNNNQNGNSSNNSNGNSNSQPPEMPNNNNSSSGNNNNNSNNQPPEQPNSNNNTQSS